MTDAIITDFKANLFVIGVNKAGTTWLHGLLNSHPEISMSKTKELNYFGAEYPRNLEKYHLNYVMNDRVKYYGESSTSYYRNQDVAAQLLEYNPEAKVIVMLRDPVNRLLSHFFFCKQLGEIPEKVTLDEILDEKDHPIVIDSHYEITIPRHQELFIDSFYANRLEIALSDPDKFWIEIQQFLNLEEIPLPEEGTDSKNVTGGKGFRYVYRWTIQPIKEKQPELYETLLDSSFLKFSRKALISLFGKAEKDSFPIEIKERLAQEFDVTYRYLDSLGLSWKKKSEKEISS